MRSYLVFFVLLSLYGTFGYFWMSRKPASHYSSQHAAQAQAQAGNSTKGKAAVRGVKEKAKLKPVLGRPMKVVALGWGLLAPGVVANQGAQGKPVSKKSKSAFSQAGLSVAFSSRSQVKHLERALAKGGAAPGGADIMLLPLAQFVASYERLKALSPQVFFGIGWSQGKERIYTQKGYSLQRIFRTRKVRLLTTPLSTEAFVGLYVLHLAGVSPDKVQLILPTHPKAKKVKIASLPANKKWGHLTRNKALFLSTADATRLLPLVAVAPKGFLKSHPRAVEVWMRIWMRGVEELQKDVPGAARSIAALSGSPDALELLKELGQIHLASMRENAQLFGLSGRSAAHISRHFQENWRIWRKAEVLTTPPPERLPLHTGAVASLARKYPRLFKKDATPTGKKSPIQAGDVLFTHYAPQGKKFQTQAWADRVGMLSEIFGRLPIRLNVRYSKKRTEDLLARVLYRFHLPTPQRLQYTRTGYKRRAPAMIQILRRP